MALTAKFLADFTDFYSAVSKATSQLDGLQKEATDAGLSLNKMVESLSGEKTIKNAMSLAAAVDALGGTSKLTAKELERVGRTAAEAVEKATALGVEVPPQLQNLAKATRDTGDAFDGGLSALTKFAGGFFTLAVAWKGLKAGFDVVKDFLVDSLALAAKASAVYSEKVLELSNNWTDLKVSIGQAVTQNQTVIALFAEVSRALKEMQTGFKGNRETMNLVSDSVILLVRAFALLMDVFGQMARPIRSTIKELQFFPEAAAKAVHGVLVMERALVRLGAGSEEGVKNLEAAEATLRGYAADLQVGVDATTTFMNVTGTLSTRANELATSLEATRGKTVSLAEETKAAARAHANSAEVLNAAKKAAEEHAKAQQKFEESVRASRVATVTMLPTIRAFVDEERDLIRSHDDLTKYMRQSQVQIGAWGQTVRVQMLPAVRDWAPALDEAAAATQSFGATVEQYLAKDFGRIVVDALAGGGNVIKASMAGLGNAIVGPGSSLAKSLTSGIGKVFGQSGMMGQIGKTLGSFVPMIGPMLGPAIEGVTKLFGAVFGKSEESSKVSPLRDEFFKLQGGIETLNPRVEALTGNLSMVQAVFDAKTVEEYNAAIANLNTLFQQEADALNLVTETAKKYGLTLEELGPAFARQELDKKAQELYKDYQVLIAAGVKNTTVTKKMADEVNKYVQQAMKMGVAVPSAMKPMLEQMAKMGVLTDSSGKKIKDVEKSGIKFALTMSEGFEKLIDSVQQLTHVIAGSLGVQLEKTKDRVNAIPNKINIKVNYDEGDRPKALKSGTVSVKGYQGGTKGFEDFGAGTLVMLHGREAVVPEHAVKRVGGGGPVAASAGVTIVINAQGAFFDTPGDLQRLADKVNAALTAKHGLTNRSRAA